MLIERKYGIIPIFMLQQITSLMKFQTNSPKISTIQALPFLSFLVILLLCYASCNSPNQYEAANSEKDIEAATKDFEVTLTVKDNVKGTSEIMHLSTDNYYLFLTVDKDKRTVEVSTVADLDYHIEASFKGKDKTDIVTFATLLQLQGSGTDTIHARLIGNKGVTE